MILVTRRRLKRLTVGDYDLGHLDMPYGTEFYSSIAMRALLHTEFAAVLARAGTSRGRAAVPPWAAGLAVVLEPHSPEAIAMPVEETTFTWHETLGVPPDADAARRTMRRLAHIPHRPRRGTLQQITTSRGRTRASPPSSPFRPRTRAAWAFGAAHHARQAKR